jgi:hypothetical protein
MSRLTSQFARIVATDSGIAASYKHGPKFVVAGEPIEPLGAILKWYALHRERQPVPDEITRLARNRLTMVPLEARGLGFAVLHRCEKDFYFLIICTWRNSNELWQTVLHKDGDATQAFEPFPRDCAHKPTWCVWELVPVWHEQQAWLRFLASARDAPAAQAWLNDTYEGLA